MDASLRVMGNQTDNLLALVIKDEGAKYLVYLRALDNNMLIPFMHNGKRIGFISHEKFLHLFDNLNNTIANTICLTLGFISTDV